jgi:S1-C subfamily serine protease
LVFFLLSPKFLWANDKVDKLLRPFVSVLGSSGIVVKKTEKDKIFTLTILSAYHVIDVRLSTKTQIDVGLHSFTPNGKISKTTSVIAAVLRYSETLDFAILSCETEIDYPVAQLATLETLKNTSVSDTIYSVGSPTNTTIWMSQGIIASMDLQIKEPYFGHTAIGYFGSSGGPVYNESFEVIGINLRLGPGINGPLESMVYACPINQIFDNLSEKERQEYLPIEIE